MLNVQVKGRLARKLLPEHTDTHTGPIALFGPPKWSVKIRRQLVSYRKDQLSLTNPRDALHHRECAGAFNLPHLHFGASVGGDFV